MKLIKNVSTIGGLTAVSRLFGFLRDIPQHNLDLLRDIPQQMLGTLYVLRDVPQKIQICLRDIPQRFHLF